MNILFLHGSSDLYGASKILLHTIDNCAKAGHNCTVILPAEGPLAEQIRKNKQKLYLFNLAVLRKKYFSLSGILNRIKYFSKAHKKIDDLIIKENIEIVFTNTTAILVGAFSAKKRNIKHIWHVHEIIKKPLFLKLLIGYGLKYYANKIICVSASVMENWKNLVPLKSLILIHNGIIPSNVKVTNNSRESSFVIGMAGRIHYWKGQIYFLEIAKHLLLKKPDLKFKIAGDPFPGYEYLLDEIQVFIEKNNMRNNVIYEGLIKDMSNFYQEIDLFILPSTQPDPFPTVILEAMDHGLAVAATAHGGPLEMIVDNKTGILIPWDNAKIASERIENILDKNLLQMMGKEGNKRVHTFFNRTYFENKLLNVIETI